MPALSDKKSNQLKYPAPSFVLNLTLLLLNLNYHYQKRFKALNLIYVILIRRVL